MIGIYKLINMGNILRRKKFIEEDFGTKNIDKFYELVDKEPGSVWGIY